MKLCTSELHMVLGIRVIHDNWRWEGPMLLFLAYTVQLYAVFESK